MKSCRTCRFLRVLPEADGKVRIRKYRTYQCTAPLQNVEELQLPASIRVGNGWNDFVWPPHGLRQMEPDDPRSATCVKWEKRT